MFSGKDSNHRLEKLKYYIEKLWQIPELAAGEDTESINFEFNIILRQVS